MAQEIWREACWPKARAKERLVWQWLRGEERGVDSCSFQSMSGVALI